MSLPLDAVTGFQVTLADGALVMLTALVIAGMILWIADQLPRCSRSDRAVLLLCILLSSHGFLFGVILMPAVLLGTWISFFTIEYTLALLRPALPCVLTILAFVFGLPYSAPHQPEMMSKKQRRCLVKLFNRLEKKRRRRAAREPQLPCALVLLISGIRACLIVTFALCAAALLKVALTVFIWALAAYSYYIVFRCLSWYAQEKWS